MPDKAFNTLVISDLHLGEDLSGGANEATTRYIDRVERQLVDFLRHYTPRRDSGRPWRLVINGDMIDFLAVCLPADDPRLAGCETEITPEDQGYGLPRRPGVSEAKMERVAERHPEFFRALARFLARGNRVEITCGNHDAELYWPNVQEAFRDAVVSGWRSMPESRRRGAASASAVAEGIGFHPWFFYEEGVAWIEHGHQYDETCSFEYGLNPVQADRDELVTNVDSAAARYVTNSVEEADPHAHEEWSFRGYLSFGVGLGLRGLVRVARAYGMFAAVLVRVWRRHAAPSSANRERGDVHDERLRGLAAEWRMSEETLRALAGFHRRPIIRNLRRLARVLMIDTLVISLVTVTLSVIAVLALPMPWKVAAPALLAGAGYLAARVSSRGRCVDPSVPLQLVPERIVRHIDARFVVFGHTHRPVAHQLREDSWYFNTGTWVPAGKPGLLRAFTHLVIRHTERGPRAELCQWRDGASRPFVPEEGWSIATAPTEPVPVPELAAAEAVTDKVEVETA